MSRITGRPIRNFMHNHIPHNSWYSQNKDIFNQTIKDDDQLDDFLWDATQSASRYTGRQYRNDVIDGAITPTPSFNDGFWGNLWDAVHYPYALKNGLFSDFGLAERKQ